MTAGSDPGWYPDPDDESGARYWDGQAWTDRTRTLDAPDAPSARSRLPGPVLVIGAIAAIAIGVVVALLLTRGGGEGEEVIEAAGSDSPDTDPTEEPTTTTTDATTTTTVAGGGASASGVSDEWVAVLASVDRAGGEAVADQRHAEIQGRFPDAVQIPSDEFASLRPGYWVSYVGPFPDGDSVVAFCRENGLSVPQQCYGRFLSDDPADAALIADG